MNPLIGAKSRNCSWKNQDLHLSLTVNHLMGVSFCQNLKNCWFLFESLHWLHLLNFSKIVMWLKWCIPLSTKIMQKLKRIVTSCSEKSPMNLIVTQISNYIRIKIFVKKSLTPFWIPSLIPLAGFSKNSHVAQMMHPIIYCDQAKVEKNSYKVFWQKVQ